MRILTVLSLMIFVLNVAALKAQTVTGESIVSYDASSGQAEAYAYTDMDYTIAYWYSARVDTNLTDNSSIVQSSSNIGNPTAEASMTYTGSNGDNYLVQSAHSVIPLYQNTGYCGANYEWDDAYALSYIAASVEYGSAPQIGGGSQGSNTWVGSYASEASLPVQYTITLGDTYATASGDSTPTISGIDPNDWASGATTPNVTITGANFGSNAPTINFSPSSGISYTLSSNTDTQIIADVTVQTGTPTEDVDVTVTSNGYGGSGFAPGGSGTSATSTSAKAHVNAPPNSPEVTVVAWIDGTQPDIVNFLNGGMNAGVNPSLLSDLNSTGYQCVKEVTFWALLRIPRDVKNQTDINYASVWGIAHSPNPNPGPTINPQTLSQNVYAYRMFNDYGGSQPNANGALAGTTPDPCNWVGGTINGWLGGGQASQYNGNTGTSSSGKQYQVADVRVGKGGQLAYQTVSAVTSLRTVPWIYSVIEFDSAGDPFASDVASFPTYSVYVNNSLVATYTQSSVLSFFSNYTQSNEASWSPAP